MRIGILLFFLLVTSFRTDAQDRCATQSPSSGEFEIWIQEKIQERKLRVGESQLATIYQIPVVVHVFHKGESVGTGVNLSEERIRAQIDTLTADFRRLNADAANTPTEFLPVAADIEIEFILAKKDPAGNPTNGIVRLRGSRDTYRANTHRPLLRSESFWPAEHYLNIYLLDLQTFLGYASFPLTSLEGISNDSDDYTFDGVLVDYEYFGVNPSASSFESYGRTLTHEVGHYLGLRHVWGDGGCSIDDFVDDTPFADTDNGGYGSPCQWPNPDDDEVCVPGEDEMFQNFMDYTDDICMNLFTEGQKTRMRTIMDNAPNRTSLITSPGLIDPVRFADDLAAVKILSPDLAECSGLVTPQLRIVNYGTTEITTYEVQLLIDSNPIGSPQLVATTLSPLASDTVTFSSASISSSSVVSFEITSVNGGSDGNTSNNTISQTLSGITTTSLPFNVDLESSEQLLGSIGNTFPWEVTNAPKSEPSNNALVFKAHNNTEWFGDQTILKTPIFDLTEISSGEILFSYAHANRPDGFYDGFMIKASVDCGETFPFVIFSNFGPNLATAIETDDSFTPSNQLEWIDTFVSITDFRNIDGVQFAFVGINGSGNNIYLDDIQVIETFLLENDIKPLGVSTPLVTCAENSELTFEVRNNGSEVVSSFQISYSLNGETTSVSYDGLNLSSKEAKEFSFFASNLIEGGNPINIEIIEVNGVADESLTENLLEVDLIRDTYEDEYPLTLDFESSDQWTLASTGLDTLWERVDSNSGRSLRANGFDAVDLEGNSWFISPRLNTGGLDSAGLVFKASYANKPGFNDRLQVFISLDCGQSYSSAPILDLDADSLAITTSTEKWIPSDENDWKEFRVDISETIPFNNDIRIAFVFIPGGGNDLYIDDISIRENDPPTYLNVFRTYPNPATTTFNVGFNLPQKEAITLRILDMSGRIIFEEDIENALNQVLEYQAPSQQGLYFINVSGSKFSRSQKLFINR